MSQSTKAEEWRIERAKRMNSNAASAPKCAGLEGCHELEGVMYDLFVHDPKCPKGALPADRAASAPPEDEVKLLRTALTQAAIPLEVLNTTECDEAALALSPELKKEIQSAVLAIRAAITVSDRAASAPKSITPLLQKIIEICDAGSAQEFDDADERLRAIRGLIIGEAV